MRRAQHPPRAVSSSPRRSRYGAARTVRRPERPTVLAPDPSTSVGDSLSAPSTTHVVISETVAAAVAKGEPVLALESTIFTHGLPRPSNVEVALDAEEQIRGLGVVPATVGVVDGVATVGLSAEQIKRLAYDDDVI